MATIEESFSSGLTIAFGTRSDNRCIEGQPCNFSENLEEPISIKDEMIKVRNWKITPDARHETDFASQVINESFRDLTYLFKQKNSSRGMEELKLTKEEDAIIKNALNNQADECMASPTTVTEDLRNRFLSSSSSSGSTDKDLALLDKFQPENVDRAMEYIELVRRYHRRRIKFAGEMLLRGSDRHHGKGGRDVRNGETSYASSNASHTNSVIGFCGIDLAVPAIHSTVSEITDDTYDFRLAVKEAIRNGFLRRWDVLVLDKAVCHSDRDDEPIEDFLWNAKLPTGEPLRCDVLWLPADLPELNPMKSLFKVLFGQLRTKHARKKNKRDNHHSVVDTARQIINDFNHELVDKCYAECGY